MKTELDKEDHSLPRSKGQSQLWKRKNNNVLTSCKKHSKKNRGLSKILSLLYRQVSVHIRAGSVIRWSKT